MKIKTRYPLNDESLKDILTVSNCHSLQHPRNRATVLSRNGNCYFGYLLNCIVSPKLLSGTPEKYSADLHSRQIDFLNCLIRQNSEKVTFDLRLISNPNPENYTRGKITVGLLCKMENSTQIQADEYASHLHILLKSYFSEYEFERMSTRQVRAMLSPFKFQYISEIIRRHDCISLDTIKENQSKKEFGFTHQTGSSFPIPQLNKSIPYIYPFQYSGKSFEYLLNALLRENHPIMISCTLQPAILEGGMKNFLENQIELCEKFAQVGVASTTLNVERLYPTLLEHSRIIQRELLKRFLSLNDASAYMQIRIAAPTNLSPVISNLLGTSITESPGGTSDSDNGGTSQYLRGGFETNVLSRSLLRQAGNDLVKIKINLNLDCKQSESIQHLKYLFDPSEASCAFRFPHSHTEALPGLEMRQWRVKLPQGEMSFEGVSLGVFEHDTVKQVIRVSRDDRRRHMYAVGQTGTGKTTMLKSMILSDINNGEGVCVIDPHGDLFKEILGKIPKHRANDVVLIDPMDSDYPVGLNMLECQLEIQRHFIVQEMVAIITKLIEDEYGSNSANFTGPIFFQHMRMNMLLAMSDPANPGTLLEFHTIYQEKNYWKRWLPLKTNEPILKRWVEEVLPQIDYTRTGSDGPSMGGYIGSKFESFLFDPLLRNIFSQKRSTLDLRRLMDERKILLVNLAKGQLTETNSRFFGMVFVSKLLAATMERVKQPAVNRSDFYIYIDEFQNLATQNFMTLLSEGRKFGVNLILANQFLTQVSDRIMDSIFGNVGTIVTFRLGQKDAELMGKRLVRLSVRVT